MIQPTDYNVPIDRSGTSCIKYDWREKIFGNANVTPMWVADMDIATPNFILEALRERLSHPVLGYGFRDNSYREAISLWLQKRHQWSINAEWVSFCPGVVAGINHAIRALTQPGDRIVIQPPVYPPFFHTVGNNSRQLVLNPLKEEAGRYSIDFEQLEQVLKAGAKLLVLSNPHNPVGRVWSRSELTQLGSLCLQYGTTIIADEIHSDLILAPHKHTPIATLSPELEQSTITFSSPSKTFNIAGLASAFAIIPNPELRKQYKLELERSDADMGNIFGPVAVKAAYSPQGAEWLSGLLQHIGQNAQMVKQFLAQHISQVSLSPLEGTYLLWLDFRKLGISTEELDRIMVHKANLGLNPGHTFGSEGNGFQRMNIACPSSTIELALEGLRKAFQ